MMLRLVRARREQNDREHWQKRESGHPAFRSVGPDIGVPGVALANVRRDLWLPLKKRAGVRALDLYSLRHMFASLGRTAGESAFNVARMMGHARSTLVDSVYEHTMQSGMASVAESVTARARREATAARD
jgi:integrase